MTMSLRRHYKSCSKCHGNERLKRKAFRRLRKTDIEGADVWCLMHMWRKSGIIGQTKRSDRP